MFGELQHYPEFASSLVAPRQIDVWLPPSYQEMTTQHFPVVYMQDGQNLFTPETAFLGVDWGIDDAMQRLLGEHRIRPALVVGIWNTPQRALEYMPQRPLMKAPRTWRERLRRGRWAARRPLSDAYLTFLLTEVKPLIDRQYRTLPEREHTFVMGSSMGGLLALYAVCEYPLVFAGAGCLSTHWPAAHGIVVDYLRQHVPKAGSHRWYFDYGTRTVDAQYGPYQEEVDQVMRTKDYAQGVDWLTMKCEGAEHSERAWRERVHVPLEFLLGTDSKS